MSFHGLEMARQALAMQQLGLYTTGHNISNINTEGYSRQRVNFETMPAYPQPSRTQPTIPGQVGTGVKADTVERIRDEFLNKQYRTQNSKTSYWDTQADALFRMESIVNEMDGTDGLGAVFDEFWKSLQDLSTNDDSLGAREVVAQKALALTGTFNYIADSLDEIRSDLRFQLGGEKINDDKVDDKGAIGEVNSLLRQIHELNDQIAQVEPHGYLPNDLYDRRDALIDQLSGHLNITVNYKPSSDSSKKIAQGLAEIKLGDSITLVDPEAEDVNQFQVEFKESEGMEYVDQISFGETENNVVLDEILKGSGKIKALIENYGYLEGEGENKEEFGNYPDFIKELNELAVTFAKRFNDVHKDGFGLEGDTGVPFFKFEEGEEARTITVSQDILDDPSKIAASLKRNEAAEGDEDDININNLNAYRLAQVIADKPGKINFEDESGDSLKTGDHWTDKDESINGIFDGMIAKLAVKTQEANRQSEFAGVQGNQIRNSRDSISAVSLDEEVTNLLKFQHAYNAAARSMTATDELLDKIINGMGIVGR